MDFNFSSKIPFCLMENSDWNWLLIAIFFQCNSIVLCPFFPLMESKWSDHFWNGFFDDFLCDVFTVWLCFVKTNSRCLSNWRFFSFSLQTFEWIRSSDFHCVWREISEFYKPFPKNLNRSFFGFLDSSKFFWKHFLFSFCFFFFFGFRSFVLRRALLELPSPFPSPFFPLSDFFLEDPFWVFFFGTKKN